MSGAGHNRLAALAGDIRSAVAASRRAAQESLVTAIQAGAKLIEAKAILTHGEWLPWLRDHVEISERRASDYMRLARSQLDIGSAADLSIRAALAVIAESDDATMPLPLPGELMSLSKPWIGWQRGESTSASIWRKKNGPHHFHLVLMLLDEGGHLSFSAHEGAASAVRFALGVFGLDKQIDHDGYWSLLTAADPTITLADDANEHLRKVQAVAERLAPTFDARNSPTARDVIRPDPSGWEAAEAVRQAAEQIADHEDLRAPSAAAPAGVRP